MWSLQFTNHFRLSSENDNEDDNIYYNSFHVGPLPPLSRGAPSEKLIMELRKEIKVRYRKFKISSFNLLTIKMYFPNALKYKF